MIFRPSDHTAAPPGPSFEPGTGDLEEVTLTTAPPFYVLNKDWLRRSIFLVEAMHAFFPKLIASQSVYCFVEQEAKIVYTQLVFTFLQLY